MKAAPDASGPIRAAIKVGEAPALRAVIDVGTNSVKLLVAEVSGRTVKPLEERSEQTRLGRGFYADHRLQPAAIEQTVRVIAEFGAVASKWGVDVPRVIATSAAREAKNPEDLLSSVKTRAGLKVEIISGEQEADWIFQGVATDPRLASHPLLIVDVGGGSSEFIVGDGAAQRFRNSFRLGAVRLLERFHPGDPPSPAELEQCREWLGQFVREHICPALLPVLHQPPELSVRLIATGGTATILARMEAQLADYDRQRIESVRLTRKRLRDCVNRLWGLALAERKKIAGLPHDRADVMLTGAAIYEAVVEQFDFPELRVSTRGLRYAAVLDAG